VSPPLFLLTDFGLADPYVGILRAVIATIAPETTVHDLGHDLPPQDIAAAAYALAASAPYLPHGALVCAVVDPGVGGARDPLAVRIETGGRCATYVAPDNGLLTPLLAGATAVEAVVLDDPAYHLAPVSATFHGRDIFAPAAAHLAAGVALAKLGTVRDPATLVCSGRPSPRHEGRDLVGEVVVVDRFGNLISNLVSQPESPQGSGWQVALAGGPTLPLQRTFADAAHGDPVAYIGSTGRVEIAVRNGSASERLTAEVGSIVRLIAPERVAEGQAAGDASG
jgi:S-adenosylmethionine hydrolase